MIAPSLVPKMAGDRVKTDRRDGDFARFSSAPKFMGYLGLVPSDHSSGETKKRGRITRAGNGHVRRILVESAWSYRFRPMMSREIRKRNEGVAPAVQAIAWKAQQRLNGRFRKLLGRGKNKQQTVVALARELAGFVWSVLRALALAGNRSIARTSSRQQNDPRALDAAAARAPRAPRAHDRLEPATLPRVQLQAGDTGTRHVLASDGPRSR